MSDKPSNIENVKRSFTIQARNFEKAVMNPSKQEYLDYTVRCVEPRKGETVLEVAAGTCLFGRSVAPFVGSVACLDATHAMLDMGREEARTKGLFNMSFVEGLAEDIPFPDKAFSIVVARLAFHHFVEAEKPFGEMNRVLKPGGRLVVIDKEAAAEQLRRTEDKIEAMRDNSHIRSMSREEFLTLFAKHGLAVVQNETTRIPAALKAWLQLTNTGADKSNAITAMMNAEITGGEKTGFEPHMVDGEIHFTQRWLLIIGKK